MSLPQKCAAKTFQFELIYKKALAEDFYCAGRGCTSFIISIIHMLEKN